ncbi:MAG TPA: hypothetical protein VIP70_10180 [Nitrososphaeraceae archaeon]
MDHPNRVNAVEKPRFKIIMIALTVASFLLTIGLVFFLYNEFGVNSIASATLAIVAGAFVVFILMGISGLLNEFSLKSPLFEMTSILRERIGYVQTDLAESKKEIKEKIADLNQNIQSINNTIKNITASSSLSTSTSDAHLSSQVNNHFGEVVKEVKSMIFEMVSMKLKESGINTDIVFETGRNLPENLQNEIKNLREGRKITVCIK